MEERGVFVPGLTLFEGSVGWVCDMDSIPMHAVAGA